MEDKLFDSLQYLLFLSQKRRAPSEVIYDLKLGIKYLPETFTKHNLLLSYNWLQYSLQLCYLTWSEKIKLKILTWVSGLGSLEWQDVRQIRKCAEEARTWCDAKKKSWTWDQKQSIKAGKRQRTVSSLESLEGISTASSLTIIW